VILGKRENGEYAATVGGVTLSIPRQVAKTFLVGRIVFALCALFPNLKVLWTAHRTRTATNTFQSLQGFAKRKQVVPYISHIRTANGEQEIGFVNGSRIMFGAREQGFGRGFDEVDIEVFDEAQILTEKALEDMVAATNQSRHPHGALLFYMGTPPRPVDPGEAFTQRRAEALSGTSEDAVYIECSADQDADPDDRKQWAKANPSFPHRTPLRSMLRLRKNLPSDEAWKREALGIWDEDWNAPRAIPAAQFDPLKAEAAPEGVRSYGVKFSVDGLSVALSVAVKPAEGGPVHVETVKYLPAAQSGELVPWLAERWRDAAAIVIDGKAGAGALEAALRAEKVSAKVIVRPTADQYTAAHKTLLDAITAERLSWFEGDEHLSTVVAHAVKRDIGNLGGWGWGSSSELVDITPLDSATLAHYGAVTSKRVPGRKQVLL